MHWLSKPEFLNHGTVLVLASTRTRCVMRNYFIKILKHCTVIKKNIKSETEGMQTFPFEVDLIKNHLKLSWLNFWPHEVWRWVIKSFSAGLLLTWLSLVPAKSLERQNFIKRATFHNGRVCVLSRCSAWISKWKQSYSAVSIILENVLSC